MKDLTDMTPEELIDEITAMTDDELEEREAGAALIASMLRDMRPGESPEEYLRRLVARLLLIWPRYTAEEKQRCFDDLLGA